MVFDSRRNRAILFGGQTAYAAVSFDDTWECYDGSLGWFHTFGSGCGHGAGPRLVGAFGQVPTRGTPYNMTIGGLPAGLPSGSVFVLLGLDEQLPAVDLTAIGMPGCRLHVGGAFGTYLLPCTYLPLGAASCTLHLPNISGVRFYVQGLALYPAANPLGLAMSNAAVGLIG
jgi:hypothetical protein